VEKEKPPTPLIQHIQTQVSTFKSRPKPQLGPRHQAVQHSKALGPPSPFVSVE
jgi:hypothetical protein